MANEQELYTGVQETPERLKFDEAALDSYLHEHVTGYDGPLTVAQFKGGQSNPTYLLTTPRKKYVLRRKPPGKLLPSAHAVDREYRVMTALGKENFPVPKTYCLCEDEEVIGTAFFVMEFLEGRIFWDARLPELAASDRRGIVEAAVDALADLHTVDYKRAGLEDYGKPGNYFERQIGRWSKQYKAAETHDIPAMDKLIAWLPTAIPSDDATSIVHGDYRLDNIIMHASEPRAIGVLDWELSTLGHPLADFTYYLMAWFFPPEVRGGLMGSDLKALNIPTVEEVVAQYGAKTGRSEIPDLEFCLAYNMFRIASILQGVYRRGLDGNASSDQAAKNKDQIAPLADFAWGFAQKAGA
ncbi:MAG: phosphotransferase [Pseudomonadota bacterium]